MMLLVPAPCSCLILPHLPHPRLADMVKGYGETQRAQNPLYMTSNSSYGCAGGGEALWGRGALQLGMFGSFPRRSSVALTMLSARLPRAVAPNVHTAPTRYHGKSQAFSKHLGQAGMYRNHSLNTAVDRSNVHAALDSHGAH